MSLMLNCLSKFGKMLTTEHNFDRLMEMHSIKEASEETQIEMSREQVEEAENDTSVHITFSISIATYLNFATVKKQRPSSQ